MSTIAHKISSHLRQLTWRHYLVLGLVLIVIFFVVDPAFAQLPRIFRDPVGLGRDTLLSILGWLLEQFGRVAGNLLLLFVDITVNLFQVANFVNAPIVETGWVIVRDLANIGIIIALILLAGQAVFRRDKRFSAGQTLVELILAVILVNFSRLIAGLVIDFAQVIMMTFVNAFQGIVAGSLVQGFAIVPMVKLLQAGINVPNIDYNDLSPIVGALMLQVIMLGTALIIIIGYTVALLERLIAIWVLVIFSPFAYVARLLPGTQNFTTTWWANFTKFVFIGPVLAFMFWLTMTAVDRSTGFLVPIGTQATQLQTQIDLNLISGTPLKNAYANLASQAANPQTMVNFLATIGLLMAGLAVGKSVGSASQKATSKLFGFLKPKGIVGKGAYLFGAAGAMGVLAPLAGGIGLLSAFGGPSKAGGKQGAMALQQTKMSGALNKFLADNKASGKSKAEQAKLRKQFFAQEAPKIAQQGLSKHELKQHGISGKAAQAAQQELVGKSPAELETHFQEQQAQIDRAQGASSEGVTVGSYGRDGINRAGVGFSQLEDQLKQMGVSQDQIRTFDLNKMTEGKHFEGDNAELMRGAMEGIFTQQVQDLTKAGKAKGASADAVKQQQLAKFGKPTQATGEQLDKILQRTLVNAQDQLTRLQDQKSVAASGITLLNKERLTSAGRPLIRHEDTHRQVARNVSATERDQILTQNLPKGAEARADAHLRDRIDYPELAKNKARKMEEYLADVMGKRVKDDEFLSHAEQSGLLGKSVQQHASVDVKPVQINTESRLRLTANDVLTKAQNKVNRIFSGQRGALAQTETAQLNQALTQISNAMKDDLDSAVKNLGKQVDGVKSRIPKNMSLDALQVQFMKKSFAGINRQLSQPTA